MRFVRGYSLAAILGVFFAPGAAVAQTDTVSLPAGCMAYVTIQKRNCEVSHLFVCSADPEGHQRRMDFDEDGMTYLGTIDAETQWVESFSPRSGSTSRLDPGGRDPASLTELMANKADSFDFTTTSDQFGLTRHVGEDRLTGAEVEIDGVELQVTTFRARAYDSGGSLLWDLTGQEYIHPVWRTFLSGIRSGEDLNGPYETDERPVEFVFPDESGFLSSKPRFGCDAILSSFEVIR